METKNDKQWESLSKALSFSLHDLVLLLDKLQLASLKKVRNEICSYYVCRYWTNFLVMWQTEPSVWEQKNANAFENWYFELTLGIQLMKCCSSNMKKGNWSVFKIHSFICIKHPAALH